MQVSARGAASSGDLSNRSSGEQALDSFSEPAREEEHATGAPSCDGRTNLNDQVGSPAVISVDAVDTAEMPHQEQVRSQADQLSNVRFADRLKNASVRAVARVERELSCRKFDMSDYPFLPGQLVNLFLAAKSLPDDVFPSTDQKASLLWRREGAAITEIDVPSGFNDSAFNKIFWKEIARIALEAADYPFEPLSDVSMPDECPERLDLNGDPCSSDGEDERRLLSNDSVSGFQFKNQYLWALVLVQPDLRRWLDTSSPLPRVCGSLLRLRVSVFIASGEQSDDYEEDSEVGSGESGEGGPAGEPEEQEDWAGILKSLATAYDSEGQSDEGSVEGSPSRVSLRDESLDRHPSELWRDSGIAWDIPFGIGRFMKFGPSPVKWLPGFTVVGNNCTDVVVLDDETDGWNYGRRRPCFKVIHRDQLSSLESGKPFFLKVMSESLCAQARSAVRNGRMLYSENISTPEWRVFFRSVFGIFEQMLWDVKHRIDYRKVFDGGWVHTDELHSADCDCISVRLTFKVPFLASGNLIALQCDLHGISKDADKEYSNFLFMYVTPIHLGASGVSCSLAEPVTRRILDVLGCWGMIDLRKAFEKMKESPAYSFGLRPLRQVHTLECWMKEDVAEILVDCLNVSFAGVLSDSNAPTVTLIQSSIDQKSGGYTKTLTYSVVSNSDSNWLEVRFRCALSTTRPFKQTARRIRWNQILLHVQVFRKGTGEFLSTGHPITSAISCTTEYLEKQFLKCRDPQAFLTVFKSGGSVRMRGYNTWPRCFYLQKYDEMYDYLMDFTGFFNLLQSGHTWGHGAWSYETDGTSVDVPTHITWTLLGQDRVTAIELAPSSSDSTEIELSIRVRDTVTTEHLDGVCANYLSQCFSQLQIRFCIHKLCLAGHK